MEYLKKTPVITVFFILTAGVLFVQISPENIKNILQVAKDKTQPEASRKVALARLAKEGPPEVISICKDIIMNDLLDQKPGPVPVPKETLKKKELTTTDVKILEDYELRKKKSEAAVKAYLSKTRENDKLRMTAVSILAGIGGEEVFAIMKQTFEREFFDEKVKRTEMNYPLLAAVIPNLAIGKKEEMIDVLYPVLFCGKEEVRTAAFNAMGDIGGAYALNPLLSCLESKKKDVRLGIVKNVGKIRLDQSLSPLVGFLMDGDEDMRKAAAGALKSRDKEKVIKMGKMMSTKEIDPAKKALLEKGLEKLYPGDPK